ncbi:heterodisulfide reductase-related iron-sulfur binding cluster [Hippea jasoniae]|uniref:heterodisulfide reductase-related iron-sulfur binding cluster n=1 Tax=Hippea jasoniae TaxID=944479 RepID=UPI0005526111|nr:(Fe-S)-binding protein [Hippea jasoniae]
MSYIQPIALAVVLIVSLYIFFARVSFLLKLLKFTQPENRFDRVSQRIASAIKRGFLQLCHFKISDPDILYTGIMHMMLFFGFIVLLFGEIEIFLKGFINGFSYEVIIGAQAYNIYLFLEELFALLVLVAVGMGFYRRLVVKPKKENYHFSAYFILVLITILMLTIFFMDMMDIAKEGNNPYMFVAQFFFNILHPSYSFAAYEVAYWIHVIAILAFLDFIPHSKHLHILASIPNNYFVNLDESMKLREIDFEDEEAESFGVGKVEELTWKQVFDGYACTECGRCSGLCPAANTGKLLVPKEIVLTIKDNILENADILLGNKEDNEENRVPLFKEYDLELPEKTYVEYQVSIPEKALFQCTTCGACQAVCPVGNEHIRAMIDMKRYLVMTEGRFPEKLISTFNNLETNANPWGINVGYRADWAKDLGVKTIDEEPNPDILFFVGCAGAFDDRGKAIAKSFAKILNKAGVKYAILGTKEKCCGDSARRLGNEYLFYNLAVENIETFRAHNIKKIVVTCPHGYYTLKNEYPKFGGDFFEVVHHSQFIKQLIEEGKLKLKKDFAKKVVFHDPCYLGRHSGEFDAPRSVITSTGASLTETKNNKMKSFCCGAGGGMMWIEEEGTRINKVRTEEISHTNADVIATACPFCNIMLGDGVVDLSLDEKMKVMDIAQIVESQLEN